MSKKVMLIIVTVILLIVLCVAGYFYWVSREKPVTEDFLENNIAEDITNSATQGVLPSLQANPLEDKPDVNPADKANPFKDIKTNPF